MTEHKQADVGVYVTTDYELFDLFTSNRRIVRSHVERIKRSIQQENMLDVYPIIVTPEGKILDGQHRLAAARELKVPVYYVVSKNGTDITHIAMTNHANKRWTRRDYLNYWCEQGKPDYLALRDFWQRYEWMSLSTAAAVCLGEPANSTLTERQRDAFNNGEYKIIDMRFATMFAAATKDFLAHFEHAKERVFAAALSQLLRHPEYDHDVMRHKLEKFPGMLVRCPDRERYLRLLEELYNYHSRGKPVRFA